MGSVTGIGWTDATWNPWYGCKKVSPGCKYCYMFRDRERYNQDPTSVAKSKSKFQEPLNWKEPKRVFTCSWSDFFIEDADNWRKDAWEIIKLTPHLTYQILTKRPDRIIKCLPDDWGAGYENVWLGVSGESERYTFERLYSLLDVPAKIKFLSAEPLLEGVASQRNRHLLLKDIDWVIVGGESGFDTGKYRYREMMYEWALQITQFCVEASIPVFVKQLGTHLAKKHNMKDMQGANISEWPREYESIMVRQFPVL